MHQDQIIRKCRVISTEDYLKEKKMRRQREVTEQELCSEKTTAALKIAEIMCIRL